MKAWKELKWPRPAEAAKGFLAVLGAAALGALGVGLADAAFMALAGLLL